MTLEERETLHRLLRIVRRFAVERYGCDQRRKLPEQAVGVSRRQRLELRISNTDPAHICLANYGPDQ